MARYSLIGLGIMAVVLILAFCCTITGIAGDAWFTTNSNETYGLTDIPVCNAQNASKCTISFDQNLIKTNPLGMYFDNLKKYQHVTTLIKMIFKIF